MGRRRSLFKLPFFKFKINSKTIFNVFGFMVIAVGGLILLSFTQVFSTGDEGRILSLVNRLLLEKFSGLSIFVPFLFFLISAHFFNSKKLKVIKPNVTLGMLLVFVALLGVLQSGEWGKVLFENLYLDFSFIGAVLILSFMFIIGLILFLDTSIDVFILFIIDIVKALFAFFKNHVFRTLFEKRPSSAKATDGKGREDMAFIQDKKIGEKPKPVQTPVPVPVQVTTSGGIKDFSIKPLAQNTSSTWIYPPLNLLADIPQKDADRGDVKKNADVIEKTLDSFGIRARVSEVNYGPTVTQYALEITMGTKLSKITALSNDLALALAAPTGQVRIEAPIPGRSLVGIEIPNLKPQIVTLKQMLTSAEFTGNNDPLLMPLGLDVSGKTIAASIARMPHVLIAGTTGSGKSVILNSWITTILFRTKPDEVRLILVDPKRVELTIYNGIPHLLTEVIVEKDKIISALKWIVAEMEGRYKEFAKIGARNLESFNAKPGVVKKPYILFVIDELADLMMFAPGDAEDLITRIAQMARATGIHLVLATQRPSVDVITGLMKANIPTRVAFSVSSMIDSRVIIDMPGAEKLLGKGDMLYLPPDQAKPRRIQGPYLTEKEVAELVKFLKAQAPLVHYTEEITEQPVGGPMANIALGRAGGGGNPDPYFNQSLELVSQFDKASASLLQRRLKIGYARAARILDELEFAGYVGPAEGSKPREVLKRNIVAGSSETGEVVE